ncbi:MAG: serine hydrolase domain-containing protein [Actinopolymorphaceae bacterium]
MSRSAHQNHSEAAKLGTALDAVAAGRPAGFFGLVTQDGDTIFAGSAGTADMENPRPIRSSDRFRIASLTKTYLATVVLQLVAEDRLALSDPLAGWVPGLVPDDDRITVELLLSMRSGLPDFVPAVLGDPPHPDNLQRYFAPEELVELALKQPRRHELGTQVSYCNTNYILLGLIVERASAQRVDAQLWRRIFDPLKLDGTEFPSVDPRMRGPHALGYMKIGDAEPVVECTTFTPSESWACGAIVSTPGDVARFLDALLGGELLPAPELTAMRVMRPWNAELDYGYGLVRYRVPGGGPAVYGHGGTHFGYDCYAFRSESGRTLVLYRNCSERGVRLPLDNPFIRTAFGAEEAA